MTFVLVVLAGCGLAASVVAILRHVNTELSAQADSPPKEGSPPADPLKGSRSWKRWVTAAVLVFLVGTTAYKELDRLLAGMHVQGAPSSGLAGVKATSNAAGRAFDTVFEWRLYADVVNPRPGKPGRQYTDALHVAAYALALDTLVIIPSYVLVLTILWLLLRAAERRWRSTGQDAPRAASLAGAHFFWVFFVGAGVLNLIENALTWWIVKIDWGAAQSLADQEAFGFSEVGRGTAASGFLVAMAKVASVSRLILLAVGGLALLLLLFEAMKLKADDFRKALGAVVATRVAFLLLIVLALLFRISDQAFDVIRRWNLKDAIVTPALGLTFAYLVWEIGRRLIHSRAKQQPDWRWPLAGLFVTGVLLLPFYWMPERLRLFAPHGLAVLGGVLVFISLASWAADGHFPWNDVRQILTHPMHDVKVAVRGFRAIVRRARQPDARRHDWTGVHFLVLPQILAVAVVVVLGLATLQASIGELVYAPSIEGGHMARLAGWGLVLVFLPWPIFHFLRKRMDPLPNGQPQATAQASNGLWIVAGLLVVSVLVAVIGGILFWSVWDITVWLGTVGILFVFLILVLAVTGLLTWIADRLRPPSMFDLFNAKRVPLLALLLVWIMVAPHVDFHDYHDVRPLHRDPGSEWATLDDVFTRWGARNVPATAAGVIPLVFVATSGGGIRAAYWTARVMDCLTEQNAPARGARTNPCPGPSARRLGFTLSDRIFAMSGVSGGSLGLAAYAAYLTEKGKDPHRTVDPDWFDSRLGGDYLSPMLGWNLMVQVPRSFLRFSTGMDSAEVLERGWERSWGKSSKLENGLLWTWGHHPEVPLLMFEGTTVADGCRFTSSALHGGLQVAGADCHALLEAGDQPGNPRLREQFLPSTHDLVTFLCRGDDVRLSTGALLSARFPFVSPTGRMASCGGGSITHVVDGGYYDTSGAGALLDTWTALQPLVDRYNRTHAACIAPFFVQIDNGYQQVQVGAGEKRPNELTTQNTTSQATRGAHSSAEEAAAKLLFERPFESGGRVLTNGTKSYTARYASFLTQAHPGIQAPLGWTLSSVARTDLRDQIAQQDNADAVQLVRSWFDNKLTCASLAGRTYESRVFDRSVKATFPTDNWFAADLPHQLSFTTDENGQHESITILDSAISPTDLIAQVNETINNQTQQMDAGPPRTDQFADIGTVPSLIIVNREPPLKPCHIGLLPPVTSAQRPESDTGCGGSTPGATLGLDVAVDEAVFFAAVPVQQGVALITISGPGLSEIEALEPQVASILRSCCLGLGEQAQP
jgi:hypothetical protein